jgi:hypothetical protein
MGVTSVRGENKGFAELPTCYAMMKKRAMGQFVLATASDKPAVRFGVDLSEPQQRRVIEENAIHSNPPWRLCRLWKYTLATPTRRYHHEKM